MLHQINLSCFPVVHEVNPSLSLGSRGQMVCKSFDNLKEVTD